MTQAEVSETLRSDVGVQHYTRLRTDLLTGVFAPHDVLQESGLATRYGVSRTPVREALARLEQDGLLERVARGYRIRSATPEDVLDIYEARTALESLAAAGAADRRSALELARLESLSEDAADASPEEQRRLNTLWHEALWDAAHNPTVTGLLTRLTAQLRIHDRARTELADDLAATRVEHARVLDGLRSRDPVAAREAMAAHLDRSRQVRLEGFARQR